MLPAVVRVGELIAGKYRIERELGSGGMGAVFVATNERLEKRVALKVLREDFAAHPEATLRLTREAIAASRARHPGIVEIHDADTTDGVTWIAMELLEGESLADRMKRGPLLPSEAVGIVREALDALGHVHRQGIIHRDLKPDNLFLELLPDGRRRVKVLDFGIAASTSGELERVTRTGIAVGTPLYFSPEQASGERNLDGRADVYAMGTILFELLAGRLPYEADSIGAMVRKMYIDGPPNLSKVSPRISPRLADVVSLALAVNRDDRLSSADAFGRALESVPIESDHAASPFAPTGYAPAVPTPSPASPAGALGAGALGVGALGLGALGAGTALGTAPTAYAPATPMPANATPVAARAVASRGPLLLVAGLVAGMLVAIGVVVTGLVLVTRPDPIASAPTASEPVAFPGTDPVDEAPRAVQPTPVEVPVATDESPAPSSAPATAPSAPSAPRPRLASRRRSEPAPVAQPVVQPVAQPAPAAAPVGAPLAAAPPPASGAIEPRPLEASTWMQVLQTRESQLDACYFAHYTSPPRPRVSTQATVQVSMGGTVESASVAGAPSALGRCLEGELRRLRFPSHPWPSRGSFRLTLYDTP